MDQTASSEYIDRPEPVLGGISALDNEGIADLIRMFWRRRALMAGAIAVVTAMAVLIAFQITPRYTATARIMILPTAPVKLESRAAQTLNSLIRNQRSSVYGEIEVLTSDRTIENVVKKLRLYEDAEFNTAIGGIFSSLSGVFGSDGDDAAREKAHARTISKVIDKFRGHLRVRPPGLSNVVNIEVETKDPDKSARIANAFTDLYISDQLERKFRVQVRARQWLNKRLAELRATMVRSERAAADYQTKHRLSDDGRITLADQQYVEVNRQMLAAKAEHAEKKLRHEQVSRMLKSREGVGAIKEVRTSPVIQRLREQEAVLVRRSGEYETRFGERHPEMINLRSEIAKLRARIREEEKRIVQELGNEVRVAEARVVALEAELQRLDGTRTALNREKLRLRQLKREAAANRNLYEIFLARFKESKQEETLRHSDVEIISPAKAPFSASYPRRGLIIGFGFLLSIAVGILLVIIVERLDNGFHTVAQVERVLNCVSLGLIPRVSSAKARKGGVGDLIVRSPGAPYVEAIRSLRTSLMVSNVERPPKTILIASSRSGEGKTSLAVSLARLSAVSAIEGPVILVDCDLRQPSVADALGMAPSRGLIHLFARQATLEQVIMTDPETGLHVLPATPGTPNPPELLNSQHMKALLTRLSRSYGTVIIDSPALNAVSDARVLAHLADATVFVVEWETTARHTALDSFKQLVSAGANIAGVAMQKVNFRKSSSYAYDGNYS